MFNYILIIYFISFSASSLITISSIPSVVYCYIIITIIYII
nr:MAG TPA: hypothetical protein [Bacteriophage sp.]